MGTVALTAFASAQAQAPPALAAKPPALDPESIAALKRMGRYLVSLRSFEIAATISIEYVLDNNQKILAVELLAAAQAVDISDRYEGLSAPASGLNVSGP